MLKNSHNANPDAHCLTLNPGKGSKRRAQSCQQLSWLVQHSIASHTPSAVGSLQCFLLHDLFYWLQPEFFGFIRPPPETERVM